MDLIFWFFFIVAILFGIGVILGTLRNSTIDSSSGQPFNPNDPASIIRQQEQRRRDQAFQRKAEQYRQHQSRHVRGQFHQVQPNQHMRHVHEAIHRTEQHNHRRMHGW
jgi:membrane protein involved in colicin uptake